MKLDALETYKRKIIISIISGLLCFFFSPFGLQITWETTTISLPWSIIFPILVSIVYGWKYALIAGLSGGALFPFFLWLNNGYPNITTSLIYLIIYILIGIAGLDNPLKIQKKQEIRFFVVFVLIAILFFIYFKYFFNFILSFNPPFWVKESINYLSPEILYGFFIKDSIIFSAFIFITNTLLKLPIIRHFFQLKKTSEMKNNEKIFLSSIVFALLVWIAFVLLGNSLLNGENALKSDQLQIALFVILVSGLIVSRIVINYSETLRISQFEIIAAKEKAEESDRLKSAFLANMSHEIRTPMNGIMGFADLLKEPNLTGEEQQKYIEIIEKSGMRMLNIINDIIDISKIESGLMKLNQSITNINEQIEFIYIFFKPETDSKKINFSFKTSIPNDTAFIKTDREKVYAILTNLVKNAIKFTKNGSIEFGYELLHRKVEAKDQSLNEPYAILFYVKDTGIGIPKNRHEVIFKRFIQADIEDRMALQGAGLGLAITKAYVEMLGGKIWVESELNEGSTFHFTLPYKKNI